MARLWPWSWEYPEVLWGLLLLPLLGLLLWGIWRGKRRTVLQWSQVPGVLRSSTLPSRWTEILNAWLLLASFTFALLGFASPTAPTLVWEPSWERVALGLLLDVSRSMQALAFPYAPEAGSRLALMKRAVQALLTQLPSGVRVGIIAFAGVAVPLVPVPSTDHQAILAKVRRLNTTFIAHQGTNLVAALQQGFALFATAEQDEPAVVALILLSDGDTPLSRALRLLLQRAPVPIFTLGLGLPQPVPIPDAQSPSGFLVSQHGKPLTTTVREAVLRLVAEQTGGAYYPLERQTQLVEVLRRIVRQQGELTAQPTPRPRALRHAFFLTALGCLFSYLLRTRPRWRQGR